MRGKKFVFVGNRYHVLDELINRGLTIVAIFCVKDSYLEKELIRRKLPHKYLINKKIFLEELDNISFDFLISNGLPYRLPISKLQQANPARV
ncbi:hypothetical protein, partial [Shewanella algae]|uniref:hypothetical protein n=1 Tax=Shewanella algae TaxID=38313 RepID=UPI00313C1E60